jgi:HSP20 family protein
MAEVNVEKKRNDGREQRESQSIARHPQSQSDTGWSVPSLWRNPFWGDQAGFFSPNPFTIMRRFGEMMGRGFSDLESGRMGAWSMGAWSPAIDVSERDGQLRVRADLPGISQDDVKVEVTSDSLTIHGERKHEHKEEGKGFYRSEKSYGQFFRSIPLPEGAKTEDARAHFNNGVLEISIPVPERQQHRRQIPIESATGRKEATSEGAGQKRESKAS